MLVSESHMSESSVHCIEIDYRNNPDGSYWSAVFCLKCTLMHQLETLFSQLGRITKLARFCSHGLQPGYFCSLFVGTIHTTPNFFHKETKHRRLCL